MRDLFSVDQTFEMVPMPDADVSLMHGLSTPLPYDMMLETLMRDIEWRQESVRIYGKEMQQPRLVSWYGDSGKNYSYSGIRLTPLPWNKILNNIRKQVQDCTNETFNSVFLNLYRDHNDSMGFHSDNERELGDEPTIASVTFGATRTFILKHKTRADLPSFKIPLEAGSLLLMKGKTQRCWKHGIMKQSRPCGPRVNLTFRTIFD
ncbi:alpha-ketoglutarate-dependent dioxygenase AlkB family protein [Sphingomonas parapaucimobilis]|uniref:alpha-ketoglutarate-dependent dioxygenase AlkB family protein n=1 Tax=Sphingomonas parapaucimobilis TaxID=28213 RepID=UPI00391989C1